MKRDFDAVARLATADEMQQAGLPAGTTGIYFQERCYDSSDLECAPAEVRDFAAFELVRMQREQQSAASN